MHYWHLLPEPRTVLPLRALGRNQKHYWRVTTHRMTWEQCITVCHEMYTCAIHQMVTSVSKLFSSKWGVKSVTLNSGFLPCLWVLPCAPVLFLPWSSPCQSEGDFRMRISNCPTFPGCTSHLLKVHCKYTVFSLDVVQGNCFFFFFGALGQMLARSNLFPWEPSLPFSAASCCSLSTASGLCTSLPRAAGGSHCAHIW